MSKARFRLPTVVAVVAAAILAVVVAPVTPASADTVDATTTTVSLNAGQAGLGSAVQTTYPLPGGWRKEIRIPAPAGTGPLRAFGTVDYTWTPPAGTYWWADQLGGIWLINASTGKAAAHVNAPWAQDKNGTKLPATMAITGLDGQGIRITYTNPTTRDKFPVTIDPHYTWGWVTGTIYFNKSETAKIAASASFLTVIGVLLPPPFDVVVPLVAGTAALYAAFALADNECVSIKSNGDVNQYGGSAGDGYCA